MWRFWPFFKWFWGFVAASIVAAVLVNLLFAPLRDPIVSALQSFVSRSANFAFLLLPLLLVFLSSWSWRDSAREQARQRTRKLSSEFALLKPAGELEPEDFGLQRVGLGEKRDPSRRPFHPAYTRRHATRYEQKGEDDPSPMMDEDRLAQELARQNSFILLGPPTDGKSRTLYEVLRRMQGWTVLRPRTASYPSTEALFFVRNQRVVLLLDNLELFRDVDLLQMCADLTIQGCSWAAAGACRDGPELTSVREATETSLRRFYVDTTWKLALRPPSAEDRLSLAREIGESIEGELWRFPTLGSICMDDAFKYMRDRFQRLPEEEKDCLRAMQLLGAAGILPLTQRRVQAVLEAVFRRPDSHLSDCLLHLSEDGFLAHPGDQDPVLPEVAYLGLRLENPVVRYATDQDRLPQNDFVALAECLEQSQDGEGLLYLGATLGISYEDHEQALDVSVLASRFLADPSPALFNKGVALGQLERSEEEIGVYDDMVARFGDASEPEVREHVARALFNKGGTLGQLKRREEEIAVYDDVVARFADASEPGLRKQVARALVNKGGTLGQLKRSEVAIAVYDEVVVRFADADEPEVRETVAKALENKGITLGQLERSEEAIAVYDDVVARFADAGEPEVRGQVARALFNKGITLGQLERSEEAIAVYDDVVARFADASEPEVRETVARALVNKGGTLGQLERSEEEIAIYDDMVARFADASEPEVRGQVVMALVNKGITLGQLERSEEEIAVYDDVVARFGDAGELGVREQVAKALVYKGVTLGQLERSEEAIAVYDDVAVRFGDAGEPELREQVAMALVNKGIALGQLERSEEGTDHL